MPAEDLERPLVAGRYRLDGIIGSGGVGRVWRGEDTVLRRAVAIKEVPLPVHLPDDERSALRARVLREAQAAARIHHPGSVQVYDVVDDEQTVHLVMELVEDRTLAEVVDRDGPLAPTTTAAMGAELLGALEAAHSVGIVHRDVKPRNVMVLSAGGVKLADFGIASLRDDPSITKTGMVLGTPSYMSPEQALGETVGPATDVWGTGALLYYAVEGVAPFDRGEPIATLHAVVHGEPRPYERAGELAPLLDRLLAKDPSARISLQEARGEQLTSLAQGSPTTAVAAPTVVAAAADPTQLETRAAPVAAPVPVDPVLPDEAAVTATSHRPPPDRRTVPYLAIAGILLLLLLGGVLLAGRDGSEDPEVAGEGVVAPTTAPIAAPETTAPPSTAAAVDDEPEPEPTTTTALDADDEEDEEGGEAGDRPQGVPASWVPYTAPSIGWTAWHPPSWQPTATDVNAIDIRDPASGSYLRVDYVQPPSGDPVEAWERSSAAFAERYPDYEELRIDPTTYQGYDAAIWEYTYEGQRATNLGFVTPGTGFALNFQTSAGRWDETRDLRRAFEAGFTVPD